MKNEDIATAVGAGIVVAVIGLLVLVAALGPSIFGGVFGQTGAAWAQVFTTSAAVIGAVWGVQLSHSLEGKRRDLEAYESYNRELIGLNIVVTTAVAQAQQLAYEEHQRRDIFSLMSTDFPGRAQFLSDIAVRFRTTLANIETLSDVLTRMQTSRFDRPDALMCHISVDNFLRSLRPHIERVNNPNFDWENDAREVLEISVSYLPLLQSHSNYLSALLKARGAKIVPPEHLPNLFETNDEPKPAAARRPATTPAASQSKPP